jgi:Smg protein
MKETVLDVLMYLFENYQQGEFSDSENHDTLSDELVAAGFPIEEVAHAFAWLDGLALSRQLPIVFGSRNAIRVYAREEMARLPTDCRGFLLYLEQLGLLSPEHREQVIDRLMALTEEIDLERVKWVCLLVLMDDEAAEAAFAQVEEMVYFAGEMLH